MFIVRAATSEHIAQAILLYQQQRIYDDLTAEVGVPSENESQPLQENVLISLQGLFAVIALHS